MRKENNDDLGLGLVCTLGPIFWPLLLPISVLGLILYYTVEYLEKVSFQVATFIRNVLDRIDTSDLKE